MAEAKYETHEYDVVVIGAGGAGLRAAVESSAQGVKTALVCKSLLGKAHTVMAEGGIAAATPCAGENYSTTGAWRRSTPRKRSIASLSWKNGAPFSTAPKKV